MDCQKEEAAAQLPTEQHLMNGMDAANGEHVEPEERNLGLGREQKREVDMIGSHSINCCANDIESLNKKNLDRFIARGAWKQENHPRSDFGRHDEQMVDLMSGHSLSHNTGCCQNGVASETQTMLDALNEATQEGSDNGQTCHCINSTTWKSELNIKVHETNSCLEASFNRGRDFDLGRVCSRNQDVNLDPAIGNGQCHVHLLRRIFDNNICHENDYQNIVNSSEDLCFQAHNISEEQRKSLVKNLCRVFETKIDSDRTTLLDRNRKSRLEIFEHETSFASKREVFESKPAKDKQDNDNIENTSFASFIRLLNDPLIRFIVFLIFFAMLISSMFSTEK